MKDEIAAAVIFISRLIGKNENLNSEQLEEFKARLAVLLCQRFENHWFPEQPFKGQGYRCIRLNEWDRRDPSIELAAEQSGLRYEDLRLPPELTIWVDPLEVCCRFGEHRGSYCTVASFKSGSSDDYINFIAEDQDKQATVEFIMRQLCASEEGNNGQSVHRTNLNTSSYEQMLTKFGACFNRPQQSNSTSRNDRYHWVKKPIVQT
uniref:Anti-proliferative protein domain-containing protein n=1 Tax=Strigamia maritima TaxID=126957 RepID=T1IW76_STRMM